MNFARKSLSAAWLLASFSMVLSAFSCALSAHSLGTQVLTAFCLSGALFVGFISVRQRITVAGIVALATAFFLNGSFAMDLFRRQLDQAPEPASRAVTRPTAGPMRQRMPWLTGNLSQDSIALCGRLKRKSRACR